MIGWLLETMLGVTLLMLLVLAVRAPVARLFGAGWAYALWLLPALRLVLPPLPRLGIEIPVSPVAAFIPAIGGVAAPLPVESGPGQWVPFMLAMWAGGAVTFLLWHWLAYRAFLKGLKTGAHPGDPPSYGGIATLASGAVEGPLAVGLVERLIVLPLHFTLRYSFGERRLALEHELVHHRRGDIWWNLVGLVILAANWFNPVAWLAYRAFRSDQELACDAVVAGRATAGERHDYARALVKAASRPGMVAACPLNGADSLKRRLRMIASHRAGKARAAGGLAAFLSLFASGLVLSAARPADSPQPETVAAAAPAPAFASAQAAPAPAIAIRAAPARRAVAASHTPVSRAAASVVPTLIDPQPLAADAPAPDFARAEAIHLAGTGAAQLARLDVPASSSHAANVHHIRVARIVTIRVGGHALPDPVEPARLAQLHASLARAMAETASAEGKERLGMIMAMVERRIDEHRIDQAKKAAHLNPTGDTI